MQSPTSHYVEYEDAQEDRHTSGRRSIWGSRFSSALRNGALEDVSDLKEAGNRHIMLYRLLQWIGILDCSASYEVFIVVVLVGNFVNRFVIVYYEEGFRVSIQLLDVLRCLNCFL
jgi:hypothetical protein